MAADLRRLHYFVTIADLGSLVRAAEVLHVAQSALTRQLRLLEEEVGTALMTRGARGVALTPAGDAYCGCARRLLADHAAAKTQALRASAGDVGLLRLGTSDMYPWHPRFTQALRAYRRRHPGVAFHIESVLSGEVVEQVVSGRLDLALAYVAPLARDSLLDVRKWIDEPLCLAVDAQSKWARRPPRRLADLHDQTFVAFPPGQSPHLHQLLVQHLRQRGLSPRTVHEGQTPNIVLGLVAAGMGYALVPESLGLHLPPDVVAVAVPDLDLRVPISLVSRADDRAPALQRFVAALQGAGPAPTGRRGGRPRGT